MVILDQVDTVLITGGTGSFGQHFVKRALESRVNKVIIFSRDELKQSEMAARFNDPRLRFFLGDVRDRERLTRALCGVDIVIHAAALKQVPAAEYNPFEVVKTNVYGTQNVADAAIDMGVGKAILLSTDKAVEPLNLYGATKLTAEKLWLGANRYGDTAFNVMRYGNVWGSRGSVLPLFLKQKAAGIPLTITSPHMSRFVLTLDTAVDQVLTLLGWPHRGVIAVPKLPTITIRDLVTALEHPAEIVGIRPGEKLHETLISAQELRTDCGTHYVIGPEFGGKSEAYSSNTNSAVLSIDSIQKLIKEYTDGS